MTWSSKTIPPPQYVHKHSSSKTTYSLSKKISLGANSITSFSNLPLITIFYAGLTISTFTTFYIGFFFFNKLFFYRVLDD